MINWHRLFGLTLADYFTDTGYTVELEKDVARKRQVLDVVIIRALAGGSPLPEPCDGLEELRTHNLLTYKSGQESLDAWALEELIGHYVNYRKSFAPQAPATDFGLYAVTTRYPEALFGDVTPQPLKAGVYRLRAVQQPITLIVLKEVEPATRNAVWALFSFQATRVAQGAREYHWRQPDHLPILEELYHLYRELEITMAYTFEDFRKDYNRRVLAEMPLEERLRGLSPEDLLRVLSPEERLRGLPPEELLRVLPPEERLRGLPPEERLRGLSPEDLLRVLTPEELLRVLPPEERLRGLPEEELQQLQRLLNQKFQH